MYPMPRRQSRRQPWRLLSLAALALGLALSGPARAVVPEGELTEDGFLPAGPVRNGEFMPSPKAGPARHSLSGTLTLRAEEMQMRPGLASRTVMGLDAQMFPEVKIGFFSEEGVLVPATQEIVRGAAAPAGAESFWDIVVQPGRVWAEPGEDGWSRASFPFALMNQLENDTHNGIATFLYNDSEVSEVRMQIVQQTAPFYIAEHFLAWQQLAADYAPDPAVGSEAARQAWRAEARDRMPAQTWDALERKVGAGLVDGFDGAMDPGHLVTSALVHDGTLYYKPSETAMGPYPYTPEMRFGIWSVTKSVGPALAMLRLAQKFGPYVFDLKVTDYLEIPGADPAWEAVRFGDLLNMASGLGGGTVVAAPNDMYVDYLDESYDAWYTAPSLEGKLEQLGEVGAYPWGPGRVARYRDRDMFALGAAMTGFLRSVEGPEADIWEMLRHEVFAPIGIHHAPMNRTVEPDGARGQPIMAWGWYPNLDDLAKVARLLHARGVHADAQILHAGKTAALFAPEDALPQGPANSLAQGERLYKMGFHYAPYHDKWTGERIYLPYMSGWIGNKVVLLPGGMTAIRVSSAWPAPDEAQAAAEDPTPMAEVANRLRGFAD